MKIRKGFISNSSSTSFTCEVCGEDGGGFEVYLDDLEMFECEKGHIVCLEHAVINENSKGEFKRGNTENMPMKFCPICLDFIKKEKAEVGKKLICCGCGEPCLSGIVSEDGIVCANCDETQVCCKCGKSVIAILLCHADIQDDMKGSEGRMVCRECCEYPKHNKKPE